MKEEKWKIIMSNYIDKNHQTIQILWSYKTFIILQLQYRLHVYPINVKY